MSRDPKLLLFDIDGTLLLSGGAGLRSVNRVFLERFGIPDAMAGYLPDGKTDPAIFRELMRSLVGRDPTAAESDAMAEAYLEALPDEVRESPGYEIMPGVIPLLEALEKDTDNFLGLATGNLETGARIKLERAGLVRFFRFGGYGSDHEDRARILAQAIERGKHIAERDFGDRHIIVIGDTPRDIAAARRVGARCIAVATGSSDAEELARYLPDGVLQDLTDVEAFLELL